jgi:hypothetical protein
MCGQLDEGYATFQLALITDGLTSYAVTYYNVGDMTWKPRGLWSYVLMGVSDGRVVGFQRNLYSMTNRAYVMDTMPGNAG